MLLELSYWDPMKSVVVDAMHNLFLNLVKHHCREILQIDLLGDVKDEESVPVASPQEISSEGHLGQGAKLEKPVPQSQSAGIAGPLYREEHCTTKAQP